jgi:hypothetical protein
MRVGVRIAGSRQSGNELRTDLHQRRPRVGIGIARRCAVPIGSRDRHLASISFCLGLRIVHGSGVVGRDDVCRFLGRCQRFALTHLPRDVFHVLHEAGEPRSAQQDLAVATVEDSRRQGTLERQHRKHALLDRALRHEIDDAHRSYLAHAVDARDALLEDRRIPRQVHVHQCRRMLQVEPRADATSTFNTWYPPPAPLTQQIQGARR